MKIDFVSVVWGDEYTDLFLRVTLPNIMSAGNFGVFANDSDCCFRVYTTPRDARHIRGHESYRKLTALVAVDLVEFHGLDRGDKYEQMTRCHLDAYTTARDNKASVVTLSPDTVWSDGTFRRLRELINANVPLVMAATIRVTKETFSRDLLELQERREDGVASLTSRELVDMAMRNLHAKSKHLIWDAPILSSCPSQLYWRVPGAEGLLERCFHLHPLLIKGISGEVSIDGTHDGKFVAQLCPDFDRIHVVVDSDEFVGCTMESAGERDVLRRSRFAKSFSVACWATGPTNRHHRAFVRQPIYFHASDLDAGWDEIRERSAAVIEDILRLYAFLAIPYALGRRTKRLVMEVPAAEVP